MHERRLSKPLMPRVDTVLAGGRKHDKPERKKTACMYGANLYPRNKRGVKMLKIEYAPIGDLKPYENNAKIHTDEQIEQIKKSIQEFGFNDPIAVWKDGEIIEGHGRLFAAQQLGIEEVPIIRLDDLTDEQRRAYMLVHNKLTMNSDFDIKLLDVELDNIADIDMSEFGFDNEYSAELFEYMSGDSFVDINDNKKTFGITFVFDNTYKQQLTEYIQSNTKKPIVKLILKEILNA